MAVQDRAAIQSSGGQSSGIASGNQTWAFALVHGIGTTQPIALIEAVTDALRTVRPGLVLKGPIEAHKIPMPPAVANTKPDAAIGATTATKSDTTLRAISSDDLERRQYVQHAVIPGGTARFAATHWSDISFYKDGLINILGGLMLTSFGVRFFARSAAAEANVLGRLLDIVLKTMVWTIAIVVFPFTLVSLIYGLMGLLAENMFREGWLHWQSWFIIAASLALAGGISWLGHAKSAPMARERPLALPIFRAVLVYAGLIALLMVAGHLEGGTLTHPRWYTHAVPPSLDAHILPYREGPVATLLATAMQQSGWMFGHRWWILRVESLDGIGIYYGFMHWVQTLAGIVLIVLSITSLLVLAAHGIFARFKRSNGQSLVFATVAVISIWIMNMVALWPENLVTASAMTTYSRTLSDTEGPSRCRAPTVDWRVKACKDFTTLPVFDWERLRFDQRAFFVKEIPKDQLAARPQDLKRNLNGFYPVMWFEGAFLVFIGFMVLTALGLIVTRNIWCRWAATCDLSQFRVSSGAEQPRWSNWPRLILADIYMASVIILMVIVGFILFAHSNIVPNFEETVVFGLLRLLGGDPGTISSLPHEMPVPFAYVKLGVIIMLLLAVLGGTYIRDITKLMLDVVNHFVVGRARAPKATAASLLATGPAPPIGTVRPHDTVTASAGAGRTYPVRKRISDRFDQTIEFLLANGDTPHLVVIAHSQGTVIAFDALRDGLWAKVEGRVQSLTILTFGSPLTHVYQHYFARLYRPFAAYKTLTDLRHERRFKWINVYRIDDFVGTYIRNSIPRLPVNVPLPPGGHTAYWEASAFKPLFREPELAAILPTAVAGDPASAAARVMEPAE